MIPVVYGEQYDVSFEGHVFPVEKYKLLFERLIKEKLISSEDVHAPVKATVDELLAVHSEEYIDDLLGLKWTERTASSELPLTKEIVDFFMYTAGGTIIAAKKAVEEGAAFHIGGGFHHAFAGHAEGFCYINDIAVAIRAVQKEHEGYNFLVVDCDLHQGNGTAKIFESDNSVFTVSIHQENLYPFKQKSDLDIGLSDFADDTEYLKAVEKAIKKIGDKKFDLVIYVAGADPYSEDKLGNLQLTKDGLKKRDEMIAGYCKHSNIPIAVVLAGGYALKTDDVVDIHLNTFSTL